MFENLENKHALVLRWQERQTLADQQDQGDSIIQGKKGGGL